MTPCPAIKTHALLPTRTSFLNISLLYVLLFLTSALAVFATGSSKTGQLSHTTVLQSSDGNIHYGFAFGLPGTPSGTLSLSNNNQFTGGLPQCSAYFQAADGSYYGIVTGTGPSNRGSIIHAAADAFTTTNVIVFDGTNGQYPNCLVQGNDGNLYGADSLGTWGRVFRLTPGGTISTLFNFTATTGSSCYGLMEGSDGNLYGTTDTGPSGTGNSTIFRVSKSGSFTTIVPNALGNIDDTPFEASDGFLYGVSLKSPWGAIYRVSKDGSGFTYIYSFDGTAGTFPRQGLFEGFDGNLYGVTNTGPNGATGPRTLFKVTKAGAFTALLNDFHLSENIVYATDGNIYGTGDRGGSSVVLFRTTTFGTATSITPLLPNYSLVSFPLNVSVGQPLTFQITTSGPGPITIQWRKNGAAIPGANSTTYSIPSANFPDSGTYSFILSNSNGTQLSYPYGATTVSAAVAPTITTQPANVTIQATQTATFSVGASGTQPFTYGWQRLPAGSSTWTFLSNGGSYSGTTSATLSVSAATLTMNQDQFRCLVSNGAGSVNSQPALLSVTPFIPPGPGGDVPAMPLWALSALAVSLFAIGRRLLPSSSRFASKSL